MTHLLLLLRLRALLFVRAFSGRPGRAAAGIVALLFLGPGAAIAGVAVFAAVRSSPPARLEAFAIATASGTCLLFLLAGAAARPAGRLPLSRLLALPLAHRTLLGAGLLGGFLGLPGALAVPALAGLAAGLPPAGAGPVAIRAGIALLLLGHAVVLGGLFGLLMAFAMRSRVLREAVLVASPAFVIGLWLLPQLAGGAGGGAGLSSVLRWVGAVFPAAWAGRAMVSLPAGETAAALPFLAGFVPVTALLLWADVRLFARLAAAEVEGPRRRRGRAGPAPGPGPWTAALPAPAGVVAWREALLAAREPGYRLFRVQFLMLALLPIVALLVLGEGPARPAAGPAVCALLAFLALGKEWGLLSNLFGLEGRGLGLTLSLPVPRGRLLLGKAVAHGAIFTLVNVAIFGIVGAVTGAYRSALVGAAATEAGLLPLVGAGALVTAYLPFPMAARGRQALEQGGREPEDLGTGCLRSLAGQAAFLAALPAGGAVVAAALLGPGGVGLLAPRAAAAFAAACLAFAFAYGASAAALGLAIAGRALPRHEERLLEEAG
ncbi:MAG: hypothetical protein L0216_20520 [Planctomycetales bacterium]|nr:hypothetical protein [Planctomycetales bacterium]